MPIQEDKKKKIKKIKFKGKFLFIKIKLTLGNFKKLSTLEFKT